MLDEAADPQQIIADLKRTLAESKAELATSNAQRDEALARETAMAEVLGVINSSPGDLAPVFDAMLEKAMRLSEAAFGAMFIFHDDRFIAAALRGVPEAYGEFLTVNTTLPGPGTAPYRFLRGGERSVIEETDLAASDSSSGLRGGAMLWTAAHTFSLMAAVPVSTRRMPCSPVWTVTLPPAPMITDT